MKKFIERMCQPLLANQKLILALNEKQLVLNAQSLLLARKNTTYNRIRDAEFRIFSQWGEDGILQYIINKTEIKNKVFIEFGVEDYTESNTRFLLIKDDWSGLIMDGSRKHIAKIKSSDWSWRHGLKSKCAFIDRGNINNLIFEAGYSGDIGLLSVDLDGNDYWIWEAINVVNPRIVVIEYNGLWGGLDAVTVPYDHSFIRGKKHYSNLYFGASLKALVKLGEAKGYRFVGSNSHGLNAFFIRNDVASDLCSVTIETEFEKHRFMQSRDKSGALAFLAYEEERALLAEMELVDVENNKSIKVSDLA